VRALGARGHHVRERSTPVRGELVTEVYQDREDRGSAHTFRFRTRVNSDVLPISGGTTMAKGDVLKHGLLRAQRPRQPAAYREVPRPPRPSEGTHEDGRVDWF
jgi:hypothetical protein